jgi:hypothetical protein
VTNAARPGGLLSSNAIITVLADGDRDGLPDEWETAWGLNPAAPADATLDLDDDGLSNAAEYEAGTDPTDARSYLKVERISASDEVHIEFLAISNRTYSVVSGPALGHPSATPLADVPARPTNALIQVRAPLPATPRFYRLVTPRRP